MKKALSVFLAVLMALSVSVTGAIAFAAAPEADWRLIKDISADISEGEYFADLDVIYNAIFDNVAIYEYSGLDTEEDIAAAKATFMDHCHNNVTIYVDVNRISPTEKAYMYLQTAGTPMYIPGNIGNEEAANVVMAVFASQVKKYEPDWRVIKDVSDQINDGDYYADLDAIFNAIFDNAAINEYSGLETEEDIAAAKATFMEHCHNNVTICIDVNQPHPTGKAYAYLQTAGTPLYIPQDLGSEEAVNAVMATLASSVKHNEASSGSGSSSSMSLWQKIIAFFKKIIEFIKNLFS